MRDLLDEMQMETGWDILSKIGTGWQNHDIQSVNEMVEEALVQRGWNEEGIEVFIEDTLYHCETGADILLAIIDYEDR